MMLGNEFARGLFIGLTTYAIERLVLNAGSSPILFVFCLLLGLLCSFVIGLMEAKNNG